MKKASAERTSSEDKIHDNWNCENVKDCLALSRFLQKLAYSVPISVWNNPGTQGTVASLMDTGPGLSLANSLFFPLTLR